MLEDNGKLVETFNPAIGFAVNQFPSLLPVVRQTDGKLLIARWQAITRLHADGSVDASFEVGIGGNEAVEKVHVSCRTAGFLSPATEGILMGRWDSICRG